MLYQSIISLFVVTATVLASSSKLDASAPFTDGEVEIIRGYFEDNIGFTGAFKGCVVASPSDTNPDYLYHWQRDAAISMHTLQYTAPNVSTFDEPFQNYVEWVLHVQALSDPNGINILGEPKFNTDGSVFTGGWCRPQNDGPASRATALTAYAFWCISVNRTDYVKEYLYTPQSTADNYYLTKNSENTEKNEKFPENDNNNNNHNNNKWDKLKSCSSVGDAQRVDCGWNGIDENTCENTQGCCWSPINNNPNNYPWCFYPNETQPTVQPTTPTPTAIGSDAIPTDLDYVAANWESTQNCDLWEEQEGMHWYTLMVQRNALLYGASLAEYFGDTTRAESWNKTANSMVDDIKSFDNGTFISENTRNLDCSIIVGTLYGGYYNLYSPSDSTVLNTVESIQDYWSNEYEINKEDTNNGIPGTLIGRYQSDSYDGCLSNGGSQGHAWILCTNALADVYYRNGMELAKHSGKKNKKNDNIKNEKNKNDIKKEEKERETLKTPDELLENGKKLRIYSKILKRNFPNYSEKLLKYADMWEQGYLNNKEKLSIQLDLSKYMTTTGDDQLTRVKYHIESCNYHMSEQICETNGQEIGAYDLTWSYGTFLSAWYYRGQAVNYGATPMEREISVNWDLIDELQWNNNNDGSDPICAGCSNQCNDR